MLSEELIPENSDLSSTGSISFFRRRGPLVWRGPEPEVRADAPVGPEEDAYRGLDDGRDRLPKRMTVGSPRVARYTRSAFLKGFTK